MNVSPMKRVRTALVGVALGLGLALAGVALIPHAQPKAAGQEFHGKKDDGTFGRLNDEEIKKMLLAKLKTKPTPQYISNLQTCISAIQGGQGAPTGGLQVYKGQTVYHTSAGIKSPNGCTLFFVKRSGNKGVVTAKVVAMGYHVGATAYRLDDWRAPDVKLPQTIDLNNPKTPKKKGGKNP
jgi:hypothetical protein